MIENEFVTYEQAVALKGLGFDEMCFGGYDKEDGVLLVGYDTYAYEHFNRDFYIPAPLKQQAFKFIREKYNIYCKIEREFGINERKLNYVGIYFKGSERGNSPKNTIVGRHTFEEAESKLIDKLIEIAKKNNEKHTRNTNR
jgi:hypothetical protein